MDRPRNPAHSLAHRVIASLNREQVDYLDKIGKDAQFSSGSKLSRNQILSAMVNALKRLNLTGVGVTNAREFEQRIVNAMQRARSSRRNGADTEAPRRSASAEPGSGHGKEGTT